MGLLVISRKPCHLQWRTPPPILPSAADGNWNSRHNKQPHCAPRPLGRWQVHWQKGRCLQGAGDELGGVAHKLAVNAVDRCGAPGLAAQEVHQGAEGAHVAVQLYLAGAVEQDVVILPKPLGQEARRTPLVCLITE